MTKKPSFYLDTPEKLAEKLPLLSEGEWLAVDTEADSLYSYQERVCLLQISTPNNNFVIDTILLRDISSVLALLQEKPLIFHGADYDVSCLKREYNATPKRLFDTMIAAWLLGYTQFSLANLAETKLGVVLSKAHQTDNWKQRPLPKSMIEYAQNDTAYLHALKEILERELLDRGLDDAAQEEFEALIKKDLRKIGFDPEGFSQIKGFKDLSPTARAPFRALYLWRDERAKEQDVPHFRVMRNEMMLKLAELKPIQKDTLRRALPWSLFERYQNNLLSLLQNVPPLPPGPPREKRRQHELLTSDKGKELLQKLRKWRDEKAKQLGMESSVVATGALFEGMLIHQPKTIEELSLLPNMRSWRIKRFGQEMLAILWGA